MTKKVVAFSEVTDTGVSLKLVAEDNSSAYIAFDVKDDNAVFTVAVDDEGAVITVGRGELDRLVAGLLMITGRVLRKG